MLSRLIPFLLLATMPWIAGCSSLSGSEQPASVEPPILDRELFFGDPEISNPELSPDGKYVAFIKPYRGARNIHVKGLHEKFTAARPVTGDERPVPGYFWSRDSRRLLYVQDEGGNENYHVFAVDPAGEPDPETGLPVARDLTPLQGVRARILSVPRNSPDEIIVGLNDRDPSLHDVYRLNLTTGKRELLLENTQNISNFVFDLEGNARLAVRQTPDGSTEFLRIDGNRLLPIYECGYDESCRPYRFHKDGKKLYVVSNKGADVDLTRLILMDAQTGRTDLVESDPEDQVDFGSAIFSSATDELIATVYVGDRVRIYPRDDDTALVLEALRDRFPQADFGFISATQDMRLLLVGVSRDVDPGSVYVLQRDDNDLELLFRSRPELPLEYLSSMEPIRYIARDGLEIPAYLTLPKGVEPTDLPLVVAPHGGPWSRDIWGYDPYSQFLANRGYAVLQPNFRSSSGYGKAFLNAGNRTWGTGAMQHDITDGVNYLIEQGIADPQRIGIFGGSYGGYATLAGVTFTPELYACGVPYVAPSNLISLIESFPAYWRPRLEGTWYKRVGDPEIEADRKDLTERSPLFHADRIQAPLLVVHGANDSRVKRAESDRIVAALYERNREVEYLVAPDEGHGFRARENRLALAAAAEKFLARHLGGRYQEELPDSVATRLEAITVDVSQVAEVAEVAANE